MFEQKETASEEVKPSIENQKNNAHASGIVLDSRETSVYNIDILYTDTDLSQEDVMGIVQREHSAGKQRKGISLAIGLVDAFNNAWKKLLFDDFSAALNFATAEFLHNHRKEITDGKPVVVNVDERSFVADAATSVEVVRLLAFFKKAQKKYADIEKLRSNLPPYDPRKYHLRGRYTDSYSDKDFERLLRYEDVLREELTNELKNADKASKRTRNAELMQLTKWAVNTVSFIYDLEEQREIAGQKFVEDEKRREKERINKARDELNKQDHLTPGMPGYRGPEP